VTEERLRVKTVAGVFPPETEEPRREKAVAGVFPPETEEPRRVKAVAGVFPPETEEPRRTKLSPGVYPPSEEEPHRVKAVAGVFPPETEEPRRVKPSEATVVASVVPIAENPVPSWASAADQCADVQSCDSCQSSLSSYCHYTSLGQAKCCERAATSVPRTLLDRLQHAVAAVTPITENPIPSWASDSDVCSKKRSCDACTEAQYCKYTFTGRPQCCEPAQPGATPSPLQALKHTLYVSE
jgi:hypothetical protein